ncbi:MAG: tRNA (adenosine(37)-N6)-threonylcarbamoyltransferase complex dimerization subunit type 1 TsaB [Cyanobacterium sp. T60_A2020_053]|nr:tRNA (adenosine(37)-N6)-threonylcarbamoyltransferase complex dimerization subunit type 1 TsaB [Cyanobacterium sp. T60_A2020_053]
MSIGLALHTSSGELGLSLRDKEGKIKFSSWDLGRTLGQYLQEKLALFINPLKWHDLEFIAVAIGPGSYTSARIGVVTARTLAQQLNIPLYGISTLETLAWHEAQKTHREIFLTTMKANQKQVYGSIYQVNLRDKTIVNILPNQLFDNEKWTEICDKYQSQYLENSSLIIAPDDLGNNAPDLLAIAELKWHQEVKNQHFSTWENVFPYYG